MFAKNMNKTNAYLDMKMILFDEKGHCLFKIHCLFKLSVINQYFISLLKIKKLNKTF